jgi:nickel/cobalt transporter (NiCoT) family protein
MRPTFENNHYEQLTIMVTDLKGFIAVSIPSMFLFGMRHALDVDHITALDNLVRMHNVRKSARWVDK